jgi:hypothetical protein
VTCRAVWKSNVAANAPCIRVKNQS